MFRVAVITGVSMVAVYTSILSSIAYCQPPDTVWTRTYGGTQGDYGYSLDRTSDGGYIIAGFTRSFGAGFADVYLIKTDANGYTQWERTYGGTDWEEGYSVEQTSDGGYIVGGRTRSFGAGDYDVYLIRTDDSGDTLWTRTYGGEQSDGANSVKQTSDGGYIVSGSTRSYGTGNADVYLIKTNADGEPLWIRTYGGQDFDEGWSADETSDGGYIIAGGTHSFGAGEMDVYLIRIDAGVGVLWANTYGGIGSEKGLSVEQDSDSGYIVAGYTNSFGAGSNDVYLLKIDAGGDSVWTRTYGGTQVDVGYSVERASDGGYVVAGNTNSFGEGGYDVYLINADSSGDTVWTNTYGGANNDEGPSIQTTPDGGYIVAGRTESFGAGGVDVWLIRLAGATCNYVPGDINGDGGVIGSDVTYGVRYFKGLGPQPPDSCWNESTGSWLYSAADANGNCLFQGSDITFLVAYFKGQNPAIIWCLQTPPSNPPVPLRYGKDIEPATTPAEK